MLAHDLIRKACNVSGSCGITAPDMNDSANQDAAAKSSWWRRLTTGLRRTSASIGGALSDLVSKRKLDAGTIAEPEELLIRADLRGATPPKAAAAVGAGASGTT